MDKKTLFRILSLSGSADVAELGRRITEKYGVITLKKPEKILVMLKVRESAQNSLFYAAEALACECLVSIDGAKGFAACLGDDLDKVYAMAVIDAALNKELPERELILDRLENWARQIQEKNALDAKLAMSTKVNFTVMEE